MVRTFTPGYFTLQLRGALRWAVSLLKTDDAQAPIGDDCFSLANWQSLKLATVH